MTLSPGDCGDPGLASVGARIGWVPINDAKGPSMSIRVTDTQFFMLRAAAQRDDHCLAAPAQVKRTATRRAANKLITAGFVKEVKAKAEATIWRRNVKTGQTYALKLTAAGLKAIAVEERHSAAETDASKSAAGDDYWPRLRHPRCRSLAWRYALLGRARSSIGSSGCCRPMRAQPSMI
jgi:hypothetical protein